MAIKTLIETAAAIRDELQGATATGGAHIPPAYARVPPVGYAACRLR
jgi:hypothetical protein